MKQVTIGNRNVPAIIQGCMRIGNLDTKSLQNLIEKQLESGVNFWDHADIYGGGTCETIFGEALRQMPGMRDKLILQSKCGIRPGAFTLLRLFQRTYYPQRRNQSAPPANRPSGLSASPPSRPTHGTGRSGRSL